MSLIVLYCFATLLLFVRNEPFTVIGVFLSICYLPGLCLFTLNKRNKMLFEDLVLAFPCSIGLSSVLILGFLFLGVHVNYIPFIIHAITGLGVILFVFVTKKNRIHAVIEIKKHELWFCLFALMVTLLLSTPFFFGPDRTAIASHFMHHSALVTQIINGIFPPENPGMGGTVIGYYWGFHSFVAALSTNTNYQQTQIIFILNALSIYMIFCVAYSFAKAFDMSEACRYILPFAVIGLMRIDAGIIFILKLFSGDLMPISNIPVYPLRPSDVLVSWINGLSWLDTRLLFTRKFYSVSGMPLAVSLCFSYLLLLLVMIKSKSNENHIYTIVTSIVIAASVYNYPPLSIFVLIHAPLWAFCVFLSSQGNFRVRAGEALRIAFPYIIAILLVTPYMLFIIKARSVSSSGQGSIFSLDFYEQSLKNMAVFLVPLPVIIAGIWIAFKRLSFSKELLLLLTGTALCVGLTVFTRWPFNNSYKFNYIQTFFFAVFFVYALSAWLPFLTRSWLNRLMTAGIMVILLLTPLVVLATHVGAYFYADDRWVFSGKNIIYAQDTMKNEAYEWIRNNTPIDALIMLSYVETNWPCCGLNPLYEVAAIAERNLYVIKDTDYTTSSPEYMKRIKFRERLFVNPDEPGVANFYTSLNRQIYLLVEEDLRDVFLVEDRFKHFPDNPGEPFELVFRNNRQRIYLLKFKKNRLP